MLYIVGKPRKNVQTKSFLFVRTSCLRFVCAENQIAEVFNLTKSPKKSKEVDAARIKWRDSEVLGLEQRSSWRGTDETGAAQIKWRDSEVLVPAPRSSWRGTDKTGAARKFLFRRRDLVDAARIHLTRSDTCVLCMLSFYSALYISEFDFSVQWNSSLTEWLIAYLKW